METVASLIGGILIDVVPMKANVADGLGKSVQYILISLFVSLSRNTNIYV